jgi:hypothetical protein
VTLADHAVNFERTKFWDLKYLVLREYQALGIVQVDWVSTVRQLADVLTKPSFPKSFIPAVSQLFGD